MSNLQASRNRETQFFSSLPVSPLESRWYAIHTRARHEKRVVAQLEELQVDTFLPLVRQLRNWSDRQTQVDIPLFSCYAFVHIVPTAKARLQILRTPGVLGFVGFDKLGTPIPDEQITNLQTALGEGLECVPYPFIKTGQRVRIFGGSLDGLEGILMCQGTGQSVVISVDLLQRSVAIRVEGYDIRPI